MKPQILDKTKKKKIVEELKVFGISKIPYLLLKTGKEKIRAYSGGFSSDELNKLGKVVPISEVGMYFAKESVGCGGRDVRINLDAAQVLKGQISKGVVEVSSDQERDWFLGKDFEVDDKQVGDIAGGSFVVLKSGDEFGDIIGVGRLSADKSFISNYLPKERRVKN